MAKPITPTSMHTLMEEIIKILYRHQANDMVHFYVNNKHYTTDECPDFIEHHTNLKNNTVIPYYEDPNTCDVTKQIEYNNPKTITMTFEGPMYHDTNYGSERILTAINKKSRYLRSLCGTRLRMVFGFVRITRIYKKTNEST